MEMRTERLTIIIVLFVLVALAASVPGCIPERLPEWAEGFEYDAAEIYPIYVDKDGSAFVSATFGGEPLALLFDTSLEAGLSITGNLVEQMGLLALEDEHDNYDIDELLYRLPAFTAFGRQWRDQVVVPMSDTRYNGSIGPQYLNGSRWTLDYDHQVLAVSGSPLPEGLNTSTIPLEFNDESLMPVVRGRLNGEPVLLELDTGSSHTTIDLLLARKIGVLTEDEEGAAVQITIAAHTFQVEAASVGLLPITGELHRVRLGADVLSQMVLTVDYKSGTVAIQPNRATRSE
jgi:hypothetical protein